MAVVREDDDVDKSAAIDASTKRISVTVINQAGNEIYFKISRLTQLKKLITSYCERESLNVDSVAFLFDDIFLRRENTPEEVGLDEGDKIYTFYAKSLKRNKKGRPSFPEGKESQVETGSRENPDAYAFEELAKKTTQSFEQTMSLLKASFDKSNRLTGDAHNYVEEGQTKTKSLKRDLDAKLAAEKKVAEKDLMIQQVRNELQKAKETIVNLIEGQSRLTGDANKYKRELDAKLAAEKKVAEKDLMIQQLRNELQKAKETIINLREGQACLSGELSKVKKEFAKPEEPVQSIRNERLDFKRVSVAGSQSQRKKSRFHESINIQQPLFGQGNVKDVEDSRLSVEDEDNKSIDGSTRIHIQVKGLNGEPVFFKIRRNTRLGKIMRAYCDRQGEKDYDAICFMFNGKSQREDTTPYELQMQDGDEIFVMPKAKYSSPN